MTSISGHDEECMCHACMAADMDAAILANGLDPARYSDGRNGEGTVATRTRYATPGTQCGRGVVRGLSKKQVRYIERLMIERDTTNLVRLPGSENIEKMSLRGARDLIDRLLACPEKANRVERGATDKQLDWLRKLTDRVVDDEISAIRACAVAKEAVSFADASKALDVLFKAPRAAVERVELEAGMYMRDGVIYKVQRAVHGSGMMYAKQLTEQGFEFARGAVSKLDASHRMTLEQAKEYGAMYGVCCVCAATLTDERSIEAGIGPVCAKKF